ncbi:MAG: restriction endonuclease [Actinobacteria bacterium]|nr:restriction endonuclease [Actinomycetota bacterium]MCA1739441.1 restriction endonuclease [Actinomycetota bacterium]
MVSVPTHDQLLNPTLKALHELGGSASTAELLEQIIEDLQPSREIVEQPHPGKSNQTELEYRLAWTRTYLKKYGAIINSTRGVWALTPKGQNLKIVDPQTVVRFVREQSRRKLQGRAEPTEVDEGHTEQGTDEEETASWRETLMSTLLDMQPDAFERLCQRLLRESGFIQVEVTGRSGDGGIDGHGLVRLAGLISFPVIFQCKRYRNTISSSVVRDFRGAMVGRADKGLIITTGSFTRDASAEATRDGAPPIDLIDGEQLIDKLKDLKLGITTRQVELVEVDTKWFSAI